MDILSFLLLLVIGGLAGWAATKLFKTDKQNSVFTYVLIGVIGAVVGKLLIELAGFEIVGSGVVVDFIVAFVGAVVLVGLSKLVAGKILR
jgi:uncharacterized membrane protein YeaQ/YmgE (transglycosylase-associated protein family)